MHSGSPRLVWMFLNPVLMPESPDLPEICRSILRPLSDIFRDGDIAAAFYPYIGLHHTIRRRGNTWTVRISDLCSEAPREVLESVVLLLASKVLRRKPPADAVRIYRRFQTDQAVERRIRARRLQRGRKQIGQAQGKHHSLAGLYRELNRRYFNNQVELQKLGWGTRRSWSRLGHYDPVHHTITISPVLDSPKVPRTVLSYILYHEMLHTLFESTVSAGRNRHHPREFLEADRSYPHYGSAKKFLEWYCRTRGKGGLSRKGQANPIARPQGHGRQN
jgi:hypothetical protein